MAYGPWCQKAFRCSRSKLRCSAMCLKLLESFTGIYVLIARHMKNIIFIQCLYSMLGFYSYDVSVLKTPCSSACSQMLEQCTMGHAACKFQRLHAMSCLLSSVLFCSALLGSALLSSVLFCSVLFLFILFCSVLFCW